MVCQIKAQLLGPLSHHNQYKYVQQTGIHIMSKALELSQLANDITYTEGTDTLSFGQANLQIGSNALLSNNLYSGDLTVASNGVVTLATVNSNVGSFGSGSAIPVVTVNAKGLVTAVSTQAVNIVSTTDIAGDSGTDTITLGTDTLTFAGGTGLTSTVTNNNVSIALDNTAVTAGSYGGSTAIPVITIDAQGRITGASTSSINTDLVSDTSPQLGGDLESNSFDIIMADNDKLSLGTGERGYLRHTGASGKVQLFSTVGGIDIRTTANDEVIAISSDDGSGGIANYVVADGSTGATELYHYGSKKLETTTGGVTVTGTVNGHTIPGGSGTLALTSNIPSDTDGLSEGSSNLYYTDARADARITNALGGNVTITGDLTVNGTTTTVNSNTVNIGDNIIVLNSDETGTPSQNGGIEIERGTSTNVSLRFNETTDKWQFTNDGTTYNDLGTSDIVNDTTPQLGGDLDVNGNKIDMDGNELILDADADTSITADTDDRIDFRIGGYDAVTMAHSTTDYTTMKIYAPLDNSFASPQIALIKDSSSPANWDYNGVLSFRGNDSGLNETTYAQIIGRSKNVSNGSEEGALNFFVTAGGSSTANTVLYDTKIQLLREQTLEWYQHKGTTYTNVLDWATPTADRTVTLPDATGTVALTSDFTGSANHAFRQISDGSNQAVADSNIDTFTVTGSTDISAVVTPGTDTLTLTNTSTLDSVTTRGATTNTSITFPDNVKARFGDTSSPDMEIYHDGSNSYIDDTGTGSIFIRSGTTYIQNAAGNKTAIATNSGAEQTLYHNNSPKFATSSTGIAVTGDVDISTGHIVRGTQHFDGGATGGAGDMAFIETDNTVNNNYSISSNRNAMTVGPVTVASGATVTVPSGQRWIIL